METILVSACLLGLYCRYDGGSCRCEEVLSLRSRYHLIPVCPEVYGGLTTPRAPSERKNGGVFSNSGLDVTRQYQQGASEALRLARLFGCKKAVLKEHSPSCGRDGIYDGTFSGVLVPGSGVAAQLLMENGIEVLDETQACLL